MKVCYAVWYTICQLQISNHISFAVKVVLCDGYSWRYPQLITVVKFFFLLFNLNFKYHCYTKYVLVVIDFDFKKSQQIQYNDKWLMRQNLLFTLKYNIMPYCLIFK